ncbi:type II secretion system major pseudopilin GspG [Bordetella ansorpii]|nr:type II secretion system major pseudopilin GspG [Bordetella ansorpii]
MQRDLRSSRNRQSLRQRGFTLIEIMIVVVIMGILAALIVPNIMDRPDQARVVAARQDISALMQALQLYRLDQGRYPSEDQGLRALAEKPPGLAGNNWRSYLDRVPNDPWGNPYQYANPGEHGEIDIYSFGANGEPGGEGVDTDIGSWQL